MRNIRGKKIKIVRYNDPMIQIESGSVGTVTNQDACNRIYVDINGENLIVNPVIDKFEILNRKRR